MSAEHLIITIGRQTGSAGKEIGQKVADSLGIRCYDKELLAITAKEGGFDERVVESRDEKPTSSFLYSLYAGTGYSFNGISPVGDLPLDHRIFLKQFDVIRQLADKESCVIVGRCADYALADREKLLTVFITGDEEDRVTRIAEERGLPRDKARDAVVRGDKKRSSYYNYFSDRKWGSAGNYDLTANSSVFGIDGCVELILAAAKLMA